MFNRSEIDRVRSALSTTSKELHAAQRENIELRAALADAQAETWVWREVADRTLALYDERYRSTWPPPHPATLVDVPPVLYDEEST